MLTVYIRRNIANTCVTINYLVNNEHGLRVGINVYYTRDICVLIR